MEKLDKPEPLQADFFKIKESLNLDEAAIEIVRFIERDPSDELISNVNYIVFITTTETLEAPIAYLIKNGSELEQKYLLDYVRNLKQKSIDFLSYDLFWKNIDSLIPDKKKIYISTDGLYRQINMNTLFSENGKYLVEEKEIHVCQDLRNIPAYKKREPNCPKNAFMIANPLCYDDEVLALDSKIADILPSLPGSEKETECISSILEKEGWSIRKYFQADVLKDKFVDMKDIGLIHLAAHGNFSEIDTEPINVDKMMIASYLLLSNSVAVSKENNSIIFQEDGCLFSKDILDMDLNNLELVVLSSCQSGLANEINTGESFGFQRAFFLAGAKTLIMSLWNVEDIVTSEFMISFYSNWVKNGDKFLSFRIAQQEIKKKYKYPFYWGGFIIIDR